MSGAELPQAPVLTAPVLSAGLSITAGMDGTWDERLRRDCVGAVLTCHLHKRSRGI